MLLAAETITRYKKVFQPSDTSIIFISSCFGVLMYCYTTDALSILVWLKTYPIQTELDIYVMT